MDDSNYKMKNMYSSVSPSEIALRCTILDLCQRLKRTEVLCDYYEQCRNELVSDCVRLRQERDYYLMAHRSQLQKSEVKLKHDHQPASSTTLPMDTNYSPRINPSFQFEKEIDFPKNTDNVDDNYEEIAAKLIKQFREEMEEIRRASINGESGSGESMAVDTGSSGLKGKTYNLTKSQLSSGPTESSNIAGYSKLDLPTSSSVKQDNPELPSQGDKLDNVNNFNIEADNNIVIYDVLEEGANKGIREVNHDQSERRQIDGKLFDGTVMSPLSTSAYQHYHSRQQIPRQPQHNSRNLVTINGLHDDRLDNQREAPTIIEVNSNKIIHVDPLTGEVLNNQNKTIEAMGVSSAVASNSDVNQYIDLCYKLVKSSINDYESLTKMLTNQNEKLRKLKGKQLRNYFRRQLDQNNETTRTLKKDCN